MACIAMMDAKNDLNSDGIPIEVKIASSADGLAHFIGPFFFIFWFEQAGKMSIDELMASTVLKSSIDIQKKIVLAEARVIAQGLYESLMMANDSHYMRRLKKSFAQFN